VENGVGIPGKVKVHLPGTIVKPQREYLVDLDDLKCLKDMKVSEGVIEDYLTIEETRYGRCSVFGHARIDYSDA
jgi:hypothetical protein